MFSFRRRVRVQVQLQDIVALVVGYALAALLFRAFWPATVPAMLFCLPVLLYVWLGLAMSGPIILLRTSPRTHERTLAQHGNRQTTSRTWAESAWILIGSYWIVLGLFVIPARLHDFKLMDAVLYGVVPVLVAIGFRLLGPAPSPTEAGTTPWTHLIAVGVLATWPVAWVCLLVVGISLH